MPAKAGIQVGMKKNCDFHKKPLESHNFTCLHESINKNEPLFMLDFKCFIHGGIILFWSCWFTLVFFSDFFNFLQEKNVLSKHFIFTSKNFDLLAKSLSVYAIRSKRLSLILFSIITAWAGLTACAFWAALFFSPNSIFVGIAFLSSLSMSAVFALADEIFLQYELEHLLLNRFSFQLLTLLVFYKL